MPIALLLQEVTAAFRYGARVLDPWNHLVLVEELLIDRARSAFLFKWFGNELPLHGFHVRVVIANIEELRKRYEQVKAEVRKRAEGPNLTEPIMGMAGVVAGMILTPGVMIGSVIAIVRSLDWNVGFFMKVLMGVLSFLAIVFAAPVGAAVVALSPALAAAGFLGYLQMGVAGAPELRALFDLLGAAARLLAVGTRFIKLLLGSRSAVKNPVLAGLLHLFDQMAKLFPFGLALVAVLVTRFGPLLIPIVATMTAFAGLVRAILDTLKFIFNDLVDQFKAVFTGNDNIITPLTSLLGIFTRAFAKIAKTFTQLLDTVTNVLTAWSKDVSKQVEDWKKLFGDEKDPLKHFKELIKKDPTLVKIDRIVDALKLAGKMLKRPSIETEEEKKARIVEEAYEKMYGKKKNPSPFDPWVKDAKKWADDAEKVMKLAPDLPTFETPGEIMARLGLEAKYGIPKEKKVKKKGEGRYDEMIEKAKKDLPPVSEDVAKYVERARYPASAFAYEKKALAAELKAKTLPEALAKAHAEEVELRGALEAIIGRVLPPELRALMVPTVDAFEALDERLTFDKKKPAKKSKKNEEPKKGLKFPVKDLPEDNWLLRPVVQSLRIHSKSGEREELRDFLEILQKKLDRPYPAPA
jgi:hypothetical protein